MNKLFISILALLSFNSISSAQEVWGQGGGSSYSMPAIEVGFRSGSVKYVGADSNKQALGYQFGGSLVFNFNEKLGLKTGLMYIERSFKSKFSSVEVEGKISYFEVPFFLMYKIEDFAGLYIGPSIGFQLGDDISASNGSAVKFNGLNGTLIPITIGAQFKFAPNLGFNVFFENASNGLADDVDKYRAVGATLMIALD